MKQNFNPYSWYRRQPWESEEDYIDRSENAADMVDSLND